MSNFLLPVISIATKINEFNLDIISGNFTEDISDHLPSFLIISKIKKKKLPKDQH